MPRWLSRNTHTHVVVGVAMNVSEQKESVLRFVKLRAISDNVPLSKIQKTLFWQDMPHLFYVGT